MQAGWGTFATSIVMREKHGMGGQFLGTRDISMDACPRRCDRAARDETGARPTDLRILTAVGL